MKNHYAIKTILFSLFLVMSFSSNAQNFRFKNQRAEEDYSYLKDSISLKGWDAIKYIALNKNKTSHLSIGGSLRSRYEMFDNRFWIPNNKLDYYSQRATIHTGLYISKNLRVFAELQSAFVTDGPIPPQSDDLSLHQGFVEYKSTKSGLTVKVGRQELQYGTGRLYDIGVGPNVRRSFDLAKANWRKDNLNLDLFYGYSVQVNFGIFDNNGFNQQVWGAYSQFKLLPNSGDFNTEFYYLGVNAPSATYNDVMGAETRHTIGLRKFGEVWNGFSHNHEFAYQFGTIGSSTISAFNLEVNWNYHFRKNKWKPMLGIKMDWASGDQEANDDKINSFNPLFVNPGFYNLAVVNTPVNLLSFHPSVTLFPTKKILLSVEYALFYRASSDDGLYSPPNRLSLAADVLNSKHIGNTVGLLLVYNFSKHFSFSLRTTYYFAGDWTSSLGLADRLFQFSPTVEYKF